MTPQSINTYLTTNYEDYFAEANLQCILGDAKLQKYLDKVLKFKKGKLNVQYIFILEGYG